MTERFTLDLHPNNEFDVLNDNLTGDAWRFEREYRQCICNRMNELSKENEQLKIQNGMLFDELEQAKAVIDNRWSEYLKKKGDVE